MTIGIDITMLVYAGSGVANYTYNLVKTLLEVDKENEYRLFYSSLRRPRNFYYLDELKKLGGKIYEYPFPPSFLRLIWGKLNIIPIEWFTGKVDVFFFSDFLRPPLLRGTKGMTTIHDLTWRLFPQYHTPMVINAHEKKLKKTVQYGDTIVVDSQSTKNDLTKYYPEINREKIHVVYPGVGEKFKPIKNNAIVKKIISQNQIPNYLLYVGAIEPRKNLDLAIGIFAELLKDKKYSDFKFIITGRAGWKNENIFQKVKDLHLEDRIIFTGFVEDEDLPYLYSGARLTVYLSAYEGFGLPPLESLACGTKVIAGNNSSLKETVDEKFLVDVTDKEAIFKKIKDLLNDDSMIDSADVRKQFNWQNAALQFLKIIES